MNTCQIRFSVKDCPCLLTNHDKTVIRATFTDGNLQIELFYDFRETPLCLGDTVSVNDNAALILLPYRVDLRINDELRDENWCCGNIALDGAVGNLHCEPIRMEDAEAARRLELRRGISMPELRRYGVNAGDCMPFSEKSPDGDGRLHLIWLYDRHHHRSKWGLGAHQWAHASTADLVHWDEHPMAVSITDPSEGSICTGSTLHGDSKYYCWYAVRMSDGSPAHIQCSVSDNNLDYEKKTDYFILPECYHRSSARDPKAVYYGGKYHLLVTTSLLKTGNGCLAHLVSDSADMKNFTDLGPIMEWSDRSQPECPDYFAMGGYYYLVWSIGGKAHYAYAKKPFGENGWTVPDDNIIDCGNVPKSAVCPWNGERIFIGFVGEGGWAGHFAMKKATSLPDGRLLVEDCK